MRFRKLQWLFPIAVTLHNGEEAIWMPGWATDHAAQLPVHPPSTISLRLALLILNIAAYVLTYMSWRAGPKTIWARLVFVYILVMLANVVVPHLPAAFWFHSYTPGIVTAVLINLPAMIYLAFLAVREKWI